MEQSQNVHPTIIEHLDIKPKFSFPKLINFMRIKMLKPLVYKVRTDIGREVHFFHLLSMM